jgi:predicted dehydrogenase
VEIEPNWRIPDGAGRQRGIGIVGCGGIVTGAHLPAYRDAGLDIVAVYDIDPARARAAAAEFGIGTVTESIDALLDAPGVDIVDIAVPPWVQPEIVPVVAVAGKHMLCQKPLALDHAAALAEVEAAEAAGVLLAVNHQMRWDPAVAASRDLIERGAIGDVAEAQIQVSAMTPWHLWPWLASAPRLEAMYHSIHYQDSLRSIMGDPTWITSVHGRYPEQDPVVGETATTTILEYEDRRQAMVLANHYNMHGDVYATIRFMGTEGALEGTIGLMYDYPTGRPDTLALYRDGTQVKAYEFDRLWIPDAFLGPMSDLMDAIETGRTPLTSGREILNTVAVTQAAYLSAAERRSVRLDEITQAGR